MDGSAIGRRGVRSARALARRARRRLPGAAGGRSGVGRSAVPVSKSYGFDRGTPIDRYYIEAFLRRFASWPGYAEGVGRGRVLEVGGREYADRFAPGAQVDVLHATAANPEATVVGDLTVAGTLPADTYDCVICTQTLMVIWDVPAALREIHRALKPGGILLATVPGITKAVVPDRDHWGDFWRFTASSLRRLAAEAFPGGDVLVESHGNLLSATLFLHGYAAEELAPHELDLHDPDYEVTIALRATKAAPATPA